MTESQTKTAFRHSISLATDNPSVSATIPQNLKSALHRSTSMPLFPSLEKKDKRIFCFWFKLLAFRCRQNPYSNWIKFGLQSCTTCFSQALNHPCLCSCLNFPSVAMSCGFALLPLDYVWIICCLDSQIAWLGNWACSNAHLFYPFVLNLWPLTSLYVTKCMQAVGVSGAFLL